MTDFDVDRPPATLLRSFENAPAHRLEAAYQHLVAALWRDGQATDAAIGAVPLLLTAMWRAEERRKGDLAVVLGLLVETEYPNTDGPIATVVRSHLDRLLDLWRLAEHENGLWQALLYLLSHFPTERSRILDAAREVGAGADDLSRLDRSLRTFDPGDPAPTIGRVFPHPTAWDMDEAELEFDRDWVRSLTPEQVADQWHNDSHTIFGFTGAKAYWAVRNGRPVPAVPDSLAPRHPQPKDAEVGLWQRHAAAFRCPLCHSGLTFEANQALCASCAARFPIRRGMIDLTETGHQSGEIRDEGLLFQLSKISTMGHFVEAHARPNFKRLCGFAWDGPVNSGVEAKYIADLVRPVDGPVLDVAAGPGGWTIALAEAVGSDRVIALDLMPVMLAALRDRLPSVPAVVASAATLPFGTGTLGAAMCWNGPHAFFDDTEAAIREIGRCVRQGGTFTTYTFRDATDPVYRHFVHSHHFPQHEHGLRMYDIDIFRNWLDQAGFTVREQFEVGLAVFITAEKTH
ncbi:class I SAM-dependent methyltransferase [Micromonospora sp. WMMA1363]|uniref:class I SAM-dependent methyltransferase n=1 Tax=Micromonospora sp. WMMA1363 TaxID=3053985 RepID=UPI00259D0466|nr:class I SAM-dependent methyltransferase [Micromonospora sp. WMMA1363]MDM4719655.1 class I SAM-dependent methyltransferase [Micromonospora sp. WMMA1363]